MSDLIFDRLSYIARFSKPIDFAKPEARAEELSKAVADEFVPDKTVIVQKNDEDGPSATLYSAGAVISVNYDDEYIGNGMTLSADARDDLDKSVSIMSKLLSSDTTPAIYRTAMAKISGFYLPEKNGDDETNSKEINSLINNLFPAQSVKPKNFNLTLKFDTDWGNKELSYELVKNEKTNLYAIKVTIYCFIHPEDGKKLTDSDVISWMKRVDMLKEIQGEQTALDSLTK